MALAGQFQRVEPILNNKKNKNKNNTVCDLEKYAVIYRKWQKKHAEL